MTRRVFLAGVLVAALPACVGLYDWETYVPLGEPDQLQQQGGVGTCDPATDETPPRTFVIDRPEAKTEVWLGSGYDLVLIGPRVRVPLPFLPAILPEFGDTSLRVDPLLVSVAVTARVDDVTLDPERVLLRAFALNRSEPPRGFEQVSGLLQTHELVPQPVSVPRDERRHFILRYWSKNRRSWPRKGDVLSIELGGLAIGGKWLAAQTIHFALFHDYVVCGYPYP